MPNGPPKTQSRKTSFSPQLEPSHVQFLCCPTLRLNFILTQLFYHGASIGGLYPQNTWLTSQYTPLMNPVYGLNINFTDILLADSSNLCDFTTTFLYLKNRLFENICNNAFDTQDASNILLLTDCLTLTAPFNNSKASKPLHTIKSCERTMHFVTKANRNTTDITLFIHFSWSRIFIDMNTTND
eukprot:jgi/Psemu1/54215/gm1.54215_g